MTDVYRNYIAGQWVECKSGKTFPNINPASTAEIVGHFQASGAEDVQAACEAAEIFREMARVGFFKQTRFHSQTSQYGTLSRASSVPFAKDISDFMDKALAGIRNGKFDAEWRSEQAAGYPLFKKLRAAADTHPINQAEEEMRRLLRIKSE